MVGDLENVGPVDETQRHEPPFGLRFDVSCEEEPDFTELNRDHERVVVEVEARVVARAGPKNPKTGAAELLRGFE